MRAPESSSTTSSPAPPRYAAPSRSARPASGASTSAPRSWGASRPAAASARSAWVASARSPSRRPPGSSAGRSASSCTRPIRSSPASPASMPAGPSRTRRAASSRSAPVPPARSRASRSSTRSSATSTITTRPRSSSKATRRRRPAVARQVAEACGVAPSDLTILYAPTGSLAGTVQIAARVLEVALHKAHALHFPLEHIVDGYGVAPIAPPIPDFVKAMGRTNDAIIYGGRIQLFVRGPGSGREEARRQAALELLLDLRQAVRRDLCRRRRRLLQDRRHAVQPGPRHRLEPRHGLVLPRRQARSRDRRRELQVTPFPLPVLTGRGLG